MPQDVGIKFYESLFGCQREGKGEANDRAGDPPFPWKES